MGKVKAKVTKAELVKEVSSALGVELKGMGRMTKEELEKLLQALNDLMDQ